MPPSLPRATPADQEPAPARQRWSPQIFRPFPDESDVFFGRVAARSPLFEPTSSAGGDRVLIGSAAGSDAGDVATRARGELLERMGNVLAARAAEATPGMIASYTDLRCRRAPALDPAPWSGPDGRAARQLWIPGESLLCGEEVLVPAGLVFLQHCPPAGCTAPVRAGSTGLAAHPHRAMAFQHAAWEVLERDLLRRSWQAPTAHRPTAHLAWAELPPPVRRVCARLGLLATALTLPAPAPGVGVVALCLHTPDRGAQTFGARCGPAGQRAELITRAAYEALMVRWSLRTTAADRANRRLATATAPTSAVEHALWAYHGHQDALAYWLAAAAGTDPGTDLGTGATDSADAVRLLSEYTNQDVIAVDTTPAALHEEDLVIVRLVAPGTHPLPSRTEPGSGVPPHPFG